MTIDEIAAKLPEGVELILDGDEIVGIGWDGTDVDVDAVNAVLAEVGGLPLVPKGGGSY